MAYGDPNPDPETIANCEVGPWVPGMTLMEKVPESIIALQPPDLSGLKIRNNSPKTISVYTDSYAQQLEKYFSSTTLSWLKGDAMIYRPGLIPENVWKYDVSGESDYGLIEPPINEPNYDLFDSNWSAQFVVFSRFDRSFSCESLSLDWCSYGVTANPRRSEGPDPHKNCPAQNSKPKTPEPTYLDLYKAYLKTNECPLIEKHLGKQYLGCNWNEPKHPASCGCPDQGVSFGSYLQYTRTYSTFWETPHNAPLYRSSQMAQLKSNIIKVKVAAITKEVKLGQLIEIVNPNRMKGSEPRKTSGKWLITELEHQFESKNASITLTLMRDTNIDEYKTGKMGWESPIYVLDEKEWA